MNRKKENEARMYTDYWKFPEKGFPKKIYWEKYYGPGQLSEIQKYDLVFDKKDIKLLERHVGALEISV
jgi:hypothetical protein